MSTNRDRDMLAKLLVQMATQLEKRTIESKHDPHAAEIFSQIATELRLVAIQYCGRKK
jgi:hypothetical protein